ncbi:F-box only protein 8 [Capsella rubella]|uniref:F-box only protein 8 n=1 Tax=Capsella rubella TaxID=81985 RepID=UPI000CD4FD84|nr:F-box only protein 8 [Capsella rubella]
MRVSFLLAAVQQKKRMKRRSRTRNKTTQRAMQDLQLTWLARYIPLDLLIEILTRLPPTSVMRFKCVSKFWSSLLSSRYFCNRFLMVPSQSQPQPRLYMSLVNRYYNSKSVLLTSAPSPSPNTIVFDQDLTSRIGGYFLRLLRGFICFTCFRVGFKAHIYNPTTRQLVILPAVKESDIIRIAEDRYNINYFLCHDHVKDQYKVLCTIAVTSDYTQEVKSELWVFLLEAGGSWKRVAKDFPHHLSNALELTMNGVLYYVAWTGSYTCVLVSFNYHGKVTVFDFSTLKETGTIDLWVVEDHKKKEWSRKTLSLQPSQMHLILDNNLRPKGTSLEGKVILVPQRLVNPFYFLCYDLHINDLKKVEIKGIPDKWYNKTAKTRYFDMEFMDMSESIMYLEV